MFLLHFLTSPQWVKVSLDIVDEDAIIESHGIENTPHRTEYQNRGVVSLWFRCLLHVLNQRIWQFSTLVLDYRLLDKDHSGT